MIHVYIYVNVFYVELSIVQHAFYLCCFLIVYLYSQYSWRQFW